MWSILSASHRDGGVLGADSQQTCTGCIATTWKCLRAAWVRISAGGVSLTELGFFQLPVLIGGKFCRKSTGGPANGKEDQRKPSSLFMSVPFSCCWHLYLPFRYFSKDPQKDNQTSQTTPWRYFTKDSSEGFLQLPNPQSTAQGDSLLASSCWLSTSCILLHDFFCKVVLSNSKSPCQFLIETDSEWHTCIIRVRSIVFKFHIFVHLLIYAKWWLLARRNCYWTSNWILEIGWEDPF